jgi:uncharacterized protein YbaA (DUF1428 family)
MSSEADSQITTYFRVCDGVRVRYADSKADADITTLLLAPWPETLETPSPRTGSRSRQRGGGVRRRQIGSSCRSERARNSPVARGGPVGPVKSRYRRWSPNREAQVPYIEGFVAAVPTANKEKYIEQAREATAYFKSLGATRIVECWGDDVPKGEVTDFYKAVRAEEDETVIFSWIEYPDRATRDAANEKMAADSDTDMEMPFDAKRMFWGGFEPVVSE